MSAKRLFTAVFAILVALSIPMSANAHSPRMEAFRQLQPEVQATREHQLEVTARGEGAVGYYWDQATDRMVVVVPVDGASTFQADNVNALGFDVRVETRDITPTDIAAIESALMNWSWNPRLKVQQGLQLIHFFDARTGKYVIHSNAPQKAFQYFLDRFPGKVTYEQRVIEDQSRWNDSTPHYGGANLDLGTTPICTSGFTVKKGSTKYMTTARHCFSYGATVSGGTGLNWGTIKYVGSGLDAELIGGSTYTGRIYVSGSSTNELSYAVKSAADPVTSVEYCSGGAVTFASCSHYLDSYGWRWWNGWYVYQAMFRGGIKTKPGDSGGPWYRVVTGGVSIVGVHNGSDCGPDSSNCIMYVAPWSQVANGFGATIVTG